MDAIRRSPIVNRPPTNCEHAAGGRRLAVALDEFAWEALRQECRRLGVSSDELASFSVLYYLADLDSGRIARRLPGASVKSWDGAV